MDQEVFFEVQPFDHKKVNLNKPATTVDEYLKQVIVTRKQCPETLMADIDVIPKSSKPITNYIPEDQSMKCLSKFTPGKEWSVERNEYFAFQRERLENYQFLNEDKFKMLKLPKISDKLSWMKLCFEERLEGFSILPENEKSLETFVGTPPTTSFVKWLSEHQVNSLLAYQIQHLIQNGYSKSVLQWIFALLLVVSKPLPRDLCCSFRELARHCRILRSQLDETSLEEIYELSAIIAIVSLYFNQKDLSD